MKTKALSYLLISIILFLATVIFLLVKEIEKPPTKETVIEYVPVAVEADMAGSTLKTVTAYNVGDPNQTDDTPCIGASNIDLCELLDLGVAICATNDYELGSELKIERLGTCYVLDRMNKRYTGKGYVDIALPKDMKKEALEFGRQQLFVKEL